jgi:hypothetical protein
MEKTSNNCRTFARIAVPPHNLRHLVEKTSINCRRFANPPPTAGRPQTGVGLADRTASPPSRP